MAKKGDTGLMKSFGAVIGFWLCLQSFANADDYPSLNDNFDQKPEVQSWSAFETITVSGVKKHQEASLDMLFSRKQLQENQDAKGRYLKLDGLPGDFSLQTRKKFKANVVVELDFSGQGGSFGFKNPFGLCPWMLYMQPTEKKQNAIWIMADDKRTSPPPSGWGVKDHVAGISTSIWYHIRAVSTELDTEIEITEVESKKEIAKIKFTHNPSDDNPFGNFQIATAAYNKTGMTLNIDNLQIYEK